MKKILFQISTVLLMAVLVIGCAKAPKAELAAANAAIDSAKVVEANRYLATEFNALQDSLNAVNVAVEAQKSKLFFSRDYKSINEKLVVITSEIGALKAKTEERKAQVRTEVQDTLNVLNGLILKDKALLAKAPKGKEGKAAMEAIQADLTSIETQVGEVNNKFASDDIINALNQAKALKDKATSINTELTDVMAKTKPVAKVKTVKAKK